MSEQTTLSDGSPADARDLYAARNFARCRQVALEGLRERRDDPDLLRLAGRSSLELGLHDAADHLRRVAELEPESAEAWRELGDALVELGRPQDAADAFRRLAELRPDDGAVLADLAHSLYAAGKPEEALSTLEQAVEREPESESLRRSLLAMYRATGRSEDALVAAGRLLERSPDDVLATLDVAELNLGLGRADEAEAAFARLRRIDDEPDHEVYAIHGMIEAAIGRGEWRRALDLAVEATRVDRYGRTTDLLAYAVAQVFGESDRPSPERADVDAALAASRGEHRRLHAGELPF